MLTYLAASQQLMCSVVLTKSKKKVRAPNWRQSYPAVVVTMCQIKIYPNLSSLASYQPCVRVSNASLDNSLALVRCVQVLTRHTAIPMQCNQINTHLGNVSYLAGIHTFIQQLHVDSCGRFS